MVLGGAAVCVFFVLSGFLYSHFNDEIENESLLRTIVRGSKYLLSKIQKFYFPHLIVLIIATHYRPGNLENFVKNLLLVQSYFGNAQTALTYNWPTWFLSSILFSYLCAPIMNKAIHRLTLKSLFFILTMVIIFIIYWAWSWRAYPKAYSIGYYMTYIAPYVRVLDFFVGMLVAKLFLRIDMKRDLSENNWTIIEGLVAASFVYILYYSHKVSLIYTTTAIWIIHAILIVAIFAASKGRITNSLNVSFLQWLGKRSFEMYIVHRMVLLEFVKFNKITNQFISWCGAFIITLIIGEIIYCMNKQLLNKFDEYILKLKQ